MKIELFLEKLNSDNRIKGTVKEKNGYYVSLKEGYVFGELNCNSIISTNQQEVMGLVGDIVERTKEEVERYGKIKGIKNDIEFYKRSITWENARMEEQKNIIKNNYVRIREYEKYIRCCNENISLAEKDTQYHENSISKDNEKISGLQKQLEEIENKN